MNYPVSHVFLVHCVSKQEAVHLVQHYLAGNQLIAYADLSISPDEVLHAEDEQFWTRLEKGLAENQKVAKRMLMHLEEEGYTSLDQMMELEPGYSTKVLHTLVHILDGFIGVDSAFFNLVEDSHKVSRQLRIILHSSPAEYWLVPVRTGTLYQSMLPPVL